MSVRQTLELTALIATQGPRLIARVPRLSDGGLRAYWTHSKCRLVHWGTELRKFSRGREWLGDRWAHDQWHAQRQLAVAILLADLPTRAWTVVAQAHDRAYGRNDAGLLAENILIGHAECRDRALQQRDLFETSRGFSEPNLFRLQRRCERFNDLLIGKLAADLSQEHVEIARWAYDADRAGEYAESAVQQPDPAVREQAWNLALLGLRDAFDDVPSDQLPPCPLTSQVTAAVIRCFPHQSCDSLSLLSTLWETRLHNLADDAAQLLEEWLATGE